MHAPTVGERCFVMPPNSSNLKWFRTAYLLNSTALVMPVLPFWWTEQLGIPMNAYLGVLAIASTCALLLDFPLSVLADNIGAKYTFGAGLLLFSLSFVLVSGGNGVQSFYLYALTNAFAEGLMSGSNNALLREIVGESGYRAELYRLNRWYYLATSALFFVGVASYLINPRALFAVQALLLLASSVCIFSVRTSSRRTKGMGKKGVERPSFGKLRNCDQGTLRFLAGALALCLLLGYFNGLMQFQNRTIQLMSGRFSILGGNALWTAAVFLFVGNVVTSLGVGKQIETRLRQKSTLLITTLFLLAAAGASALISGNAFWGVLVGYLLICILKGAYRAEYSDMAIRSVPFPHWTARWVSLVSTIASLVGSGMNLLVSVLVNSDMAGVQLCWTVMALVLLVVANLLIFVSQGAYLPYVRQGMSGKKSIIRFFYNAHEPPALGQMYPNEHYKRAIEERYSSIVPQSGLRAVPMAHLGALPATRNARDFEVDFRYIDVPSLCEVSADARWSWLEGSGLLRDLKARSAVTSKRQKGGAETSATDNLLAASQTVCTCDACCHGNLDPGNVLVTDDGYLLVGWDLARIAPRVYDEFSIVFHPDIPTSIENRLVQFEDLVARHDDSCPLRSADSVDVAYMLLEAKIKDCASWGDSPEANRLVASYSDMLAELKGYRASTMAEN